MASSIGSATLLDLAATGVSRAALAEALREAVRLDRITLETVGKRWGGTVADGAPTAAEAVARLPGCRWSGLEAERK